MAKAKSSGGKDRNSEDRHTGVKLIVYVKQALADRIEQWESGRVPRPTRSQTIRHLLELALDAEEKASKGDK